MKYTQHPLSAAFPSMSSDELAALAEDIRMHGQREPGVLLDGQVLDGWHRYQACERAGVEFVATVYTGTDPVAFVISRNAHRRHLTASQRAVAVVACAEWAKPHRPQKGEPGSPFSTNEQLADAAGTTVRTVQQAKRAVEAGLGDAVRDGMMSAKAAVAVAKGEAPKRRPGGVSAEQQRILEEGRDAFEGVDALAEADATIRRQQDRLELLEAGADDALKQAIRRYEAAEQQRDALMGQLKAACDDRDDLERFRTQIMRAVDAQTPAEALRTVRAWRAMRDEAGA